MLENAAHVPPSKMHEPDLRLVFAVVEVLLLLFGLIQDHIARWYVDLVPIQKEMPYSRCDIDDLPVYPALGPPGRKLWPCIELISSRAQDPKRHLLLFKRHSCVE